MTAIKPVERQQAGAPGTYQLEGSFTMHGVEQKIKIDAKLEPAQHQAQMRLSGSFTIKQSDYRNWRSALPRDVAERCSFRELSRRPRCSIA